MVAFHLRFLFSVTISLAYFSNSERDQIPHDVQVESDHAPLVISLSNRSITFYTTRATEHSSRVNAPGLAVFIAKGDHVLYRAARGRADIELDAPASPDHVFQIASITKIYTAATIVKLADAGALSLDDPLSKHLDGFPHAGRVTLRQLLNHTAGVSDIVRSPQPGFSRRDVDTETRIADIRDRPLDFEPGTRWAYSNSGYVLLGAVIEKITGESWHAAVRSQLLQPLGLTRTYYADARVVIPGRVSGYTTEHGVVTNAPYISMSTPAAAGGLASTVDDLHRFMRALATGKAIGAAGFGQMIQPAPVRASASYDYGLGLYLWSVRGTRMIGHTGQINGFASMVGYLPEHDVTVVVLANDDTFDARTFGRRLAAIALGEPYPDVVATERSVDELHALTGTYGDDPATARTLTMKDGVLHAQRGTGNVVPLQVTAEERLHFVPDELSYFVPVRDTEGRVERLDYYENGDGPAQALPKR